jgi:hypothetical protein
LDGRVVVVRGLILLKGAVPTLEILEDVHKKVIFGIVERSVDRLQRFVRGAPGFLLMVNSLKDPVGEVELAHDLAHGGRVSEGVQVPADFGALA